MFSLLPILADLPSQDVGPQPTALSGLAFSRWPLPLAGHLPRHWLFLEMVVWKDMGLSS